MKVCFTPTDETKIESGAAKREILILQHHFFAHKRKVMILLEHIINHKNVLK